MLKTLRTPSLLHSLRLLKLGFALVLTGCLTPYLEEESTSTSTNSSPTSTVGTSLRARMNALSARQNLIVSIPVVKNGFIIPKIPTQNYSVSYDSSGTKVGFIESFAGHGPSNETRSPMTTFPLVPYQDTSARQAIVRTLSSTGVTYQVASASASGVYASTDIDSIVLSPDGQHAVFQTAANLLVPGDNDSASDLFIKKLSDGSITRIERGSIAAFAPDSSEFLFTSSSTTLVAGDTNATTDLFRYTIATQNITRILNHLDAGEPTGGPTGFGAYSADQTKIVYESSATNLIAGDTNGFTDIFVKVLATGAVTRVSTSTLATQGDANSYAPSFDTSGNQVVFHSYASNLTDGNVPDTDTNGSMLDVFVKNLITGVISHISLANGATDNTGLTVSYRGQFSPTSDDKVLFCSQEGLLAPGATTVGNAYLKTISSGAIERINLNSAGTPARGTNTMADVCPIGFVPGTSGNQVYFYARPSEAVTGADSQSNTILIRNLDAGTTTLAFAKEVNEPDAPIYHPSFNSDGTKILFASRATNLVSNDTNGMMDVFVMNIDTETVSRVNVSSGGAEVTGYSGHYPHFASADGSKVLFMSQADNLVGAVTNGNGMIYVKNLSTGTLTLVTSDNVGVPADNGLSIGSKFSISHDYDKVAFATSASNLVAGDTNGLFDCFVKTISTGAITRISVDTGSVTESNGTCLMENHAFSLDDSQVAFGNNATNLVAADTNAANDLFVHDLGAPDTTVRVSLTELLAQTSGIYNLHWGIDRTDGAITFGSMDSTIVTPDLIASSLDMFRNVSNVITRVSDSQGTASNMPAYYTATVAGSMGRLLMTMADNFDGTDTNYTPDSIYGTGHDVYYKSSDSAAYERLSRRPDGTQNISSFIGIDPFPTTGTDIGKYIVYMAPLWTESNLGTALKSGRTYSLAIVRVP